LVILEKIASESTHNCWIEKALRFALVIANLVQISTPIITQSCVRNERSNIF